MGRYCPYTQTCMAWKLKFVLLHSAMERELQAFSRCGDSFGSTNLAMDVHGITAAIPTHTTTGMASKDYMAQFNGQFDNLAATATNSGASLDQLAATTTTWYSEIKVLLAALKTASNRASIPSLYDASVATDSTPSIPPTDVKRRISQLHPDLHKNWHRGAF